MAQAIKPQLHVSALNMFSGCGEQFRRRYIEGEIIPPGIAAVVGTATDKSVTKDLEHKIAEGILLPDDAIPDLAHDSFVEAWNFGVRLTPEEIKDGLEKIKGSGSDKAIKLAVLHHKHVAPGIIPTHVQRAWTVQLEGYPVDLAGTIDIQSKEDNLVVVRDTKTSGKTPAADTADKSLQLTAYGFAIEVNDGKLPDALALDYLVDTKEPKVVTLRTSRSKEDTEAFLRRVEVAVIATEKGVFMPARETDWWCSPRWCGYHSTCKYVNQKPFSISLNV